MCLFCKIVQKQIPSKILFEDEDLVAFHDINPVAPTHVLLIPKEHISSLNEARPEQHLVFGKLLVQTRRVAELTGILESGYRVVVNTGANAGQTVFHVHVHVIGGRMMAWPPG